MAKRPKDRDGEKLREDVAETAFRVFQEAIGERPKTLPPSERKAKNARAQQRGSKGGKKGGKARAVAVGELRRKMIAKNAAKVRWEKKNA